MGLTPSAFALSGLRLSKSGDMPDLLDVLHRVHLGEEVAHRADLVDDVQREVLVVDLEPL